MRMLTPVSLAPRKGGWMAFAVLLGVLVVKLAAVEPPPVIHLYDLPRFTNPKLAPDGTRMCAITRKGTSQSLTMISFTGAPPRELALFNGHARLKNFWWKGTDILLLVDDEKGVTAFRSLDLLTGKIIDHLSHRVGESNIVNLLADDPNSVLVEYDYDRRLGKLNVHTGKFSAIKLGSIPSEVSHWIVNEKGEPVAGTGASDDKAYYLWRTGPNAEWQRRELGRSDRPDLELVSIHPDQKRVLAWDYTVAGPARIVALDLATMNKTVVFADTRVDPDNVVTWGDEWTRPRAIRYEVDRPAWYFLDPAAEAVQRAIDAALPGTVNEVESTSSDGLVMIINAWGERDSGGYYLLDQTHKRIVPLGRQYAGYDPARLRPSQCFDFTTRDGLKLRGRLTLPAVIEGTKPPVVVLASLWFATPRLRLAFFPFVQLLATHGYAVAQFETRGTNGYGRALVKAGDYQMDSGIPNDLADGTRWLVEHGFVDGRRTALLGEQWGGLIVIQALAKNPELFKLWLNLDTPVDITNLRVEDLAFSTSDFHTIVTEMGGRGAGEKLIRRLSPTDIIPKITIPSFHYYQGLEGSYYAAGQAMKRLLEQGTAVHILYDHRLPTTDTVEEHETKLQERSDDLVSRILVFLDEQMKPLQPTDSNHK